MVIVSPLYDTGDERETITHAVRLGVGYNISKTDEFKVRKNHIYVYDISVYLNVPVEHRYK